MTCIDPAPLPLASRRVQLGKAEQETGNWKEGLGYLSPLPTHSPSQFSGYRLAVAAFFYLSLRLLLGNALLQLQQLPGSQYLFLLCSFGLKRRAAKALTVASPAVLHHLLLVSSNPYHSFAIIPSLNFLPLPCLSGCLLSARTLTDRITFISNQHERVY